MPQKNESFLDFLVELKDRSNCGFATIPSVVFEFTNGSDSITQYNQRVEFIKSVVDRIDPVTFFNKIPDFYVVMSKVNDQNKSYTDLLLAACLYNYRHTRVSLMTADLRALPAFFPRTHILSVEHGKEIRSFGIYQFDSPGYATTAARALKNKT